MLQDARFELTKLIIEVPKYGLPGYGIMLQAILIPFWD